MKERKKRETQNKKPLSAFVVRSVRSPTNSIHTIRRQTCTLVSREGVRERERVRVCVREREKNVFRETSSLCHDLSCCKKSKKKETVATQVFDQVEQGEHRRRILSQPCEPGEELKKHCECLCLSSHDDCVAHWQLRNAGNAAKQRCRIYAT